MTEPAVIKIELPLPIDITATLINIIGLTWPGAVIKDDGALHRSERRLVLEIPTKQRHKSPKKKAKYLKRKEHLDAFAESMITELDPNAAGFSLPEYLTKLMVEMARQSWDAYPDSTNYLESTVYDKDTHQRYVFIVCKSDKQTPHALREEAENLAEERLKELEQLKAKLTEMEVDVPTRLWDVLLPETTPDVENVGSLYLLHDEDRWKAKEEAVRKFGDEAQAVRPARISGSVEQPWSLI